mmetsp:Transcript_15902/g.53190  ORF Transcript_15902/g.53190 Transcript_15902/m.53190 type:complete len:206 (+) Transcript_15902:4991-5608(+)
MRKKRNLFFDIDRRVYSFTLYISTPVSLTIRIHHHKTSRSTSEHRLVLDRHHPHHPIDPGLHLLHLSLLAPQLHQRLVQTLLHLQLPHLCPHQLALHPLQLLLQPLHIEILLLVRLLPPVHLRLGLRQVHPGHPPHLLRVLQLDLPLLHVRLHRLHPALRPLPVRLRLLQRVLQAADLAVLVLELLPRLHLHVLELHQHRRQLLS